VAVALSESELEVLLRFGAISLFSIHHQRSVLRLPLLPPAHRQLYSQKAVQKHIKNIFFYKKAVALSPPVYAPLFLLMPLSQVE
jgi:hypothetical protein